MVEKPDALNQEARKKDEEVGRGEALKALHRLREIGESLPTVDAAVIVREGRKQIERSSR